MNEGQQVSPHRVKENLRTLLGGFIARQRLGQYLDFNVVVIPTGKHVTEFPTADAAFHPFEASEDSDDNAQLEIRIVPWLIVKLSANENLSRKLKNEVHNFWRAGVEQMWEICMWNRTVKVHDAGGGIVTTFTEEDLLGGCPVIEGFSVPVSALFEAGDDDSMIPLAEEGDHSWRINQSLRSGERKLKKFRTPEFVRASPEQLQAAVENEGGTAVVRLSAARYLYEALFHTWPGRMGLLLVASILVTVIVLMIVESSGEKEAPIYDPTGKRPPLNASIGVNREFARSIVLAFYKEATLEGRMALVRHPERVSGIMKEHYATHPIRSQSVRLFGDIEDVTLRGERFMKLPTWLEAGSHDVFVEDTGESGFRIDWDSLVGYNPVSLDEFIQSKGDGKEVRFRTLASDGGFHGGRFHNPDKFLSVVLNFPNTEKRLYGYVRMKSPLAQIVADLVRDQYKRPVRLQLKWPTEADFKEDPVRNDSLITDSDREMTALLDGRQVWITALEGDTWLRPAE